MEGKEFEDFYSGTPYDPLFLRTPTLFPDDERRYLDAWRKKQLTPPEKEGRKYSHLDDPLCETCFSWFDGLDLKTALPPADCFGNGKGYNTSGLGLWFDKWFDPSSNQYWGWEQYYSPTTDTMVSAWADSKDLQFLDFWKTFGVASFMSGSVMSDAIFREMVNISAKDGEAVWTKNEAGFMIESLSTLPGYKRWDVNPTLGVVPRSTPYDMRNIDEPFEYIYDTPLYISTDPEVPDIPPTSTEIKKRIKSFMEAIKIFLAIPENKLLFSGYSERSLDGLRQLLSDPEIRSLFAAGRIRFYPDLYSYVVSSAKMKDYYLLLSDIYKWNGVPLEYIRPFINPACDTCKGRTDDPECGPATIICDMVMIRAMGFGGPYLYVGDGMTQEAWEALFIGSWLSGCIPDDDCSIPNLVRPSTYGDLMQFLCKVFSREKNPNADLDRAQLLDCIPLFRANPRVPDNPLSCVPCCSHANEVYSIGERQCKSTLSCCSVWRPCTADMWGTGLLKQR